ncbi:MAG TPA: hypothetical protein V6D28_08285 [Leptolyngbyaceae cyanobacterium]
MVFNQIQTMTDWIGSQAHGISSFPLLFSKLTFELTLLAQQVSDPDLFGQVQRAWNHFVQSGQIWALFLGVIIGYFIRGMTGVG